MRLRGRHAPQVALLSGPHRRATFPLPTPRRVGMPPASLGSPLRRRRRRTRRRHGDEHDSTSATPAPGRRARRRSRHASRPESRLPCAALGRGANERTRNRMPLCRDGRRGVRDDRRVDAIRTSALARLCWALDARRWLLTVTSIIAASCFVVGCVGFYSPTWYVPSVTLFLIGSVLFLAEALARALVEHGPSS